VDDRGGGDEKISHADGTFTPFPNTLFDPHCLVRYAFVEGMDHEGIQEIIPKSSLRNCGPYHDLKTAER
jgi:hypothetical protein